MQKKELIFLQATTAPYRTDFFDILYKKSQKINMDIKVYYYKKIIQERKWKVDLNIFGYNYIIYNCYEKFIKNYLLYFSYSLINDIRKNSNTEIIISVSWDDFIVFIIIVLKKIGIIKNKLHFWIKANYMVGGMKKKNKVKDLLRRFIASSVDGWLINPNSIVFDRLKMFNRVKSRLRCFYKVYHLKKRCVYIYNGDR